MTFSSARGRLLIRAALCFLLVLTFGASARATIQYTVLLDHPERHLFHVTMAIPDVTGEVIVRMPAWNALYQIRDFSSHVQEVEALAGTQKIFSGKLRILISYSHSILAAGAASNPANSPAKNL